MPPPDGSIAAAGTDHHTSPCTYRRAAAGTTASHRPARRGVAARARSRSTKEEQPTHRHRVVCHCSHRYGRVLRLLQQRTQQQRERSLRICDGKQRPDGAAKLSRHIQRRSRSTPRLHTGTSRPLETTGPRLDRRLHNRHAQRPRAVHRAPPRLAIQATGNAQARLHRLDHSTGCQHGGSL